MTEACPMKWFERETVGMIRIQGGSVVFDRVFNEHREITPELRRKALDLTSLPTLPRLLFVEASLTKNLNAVVRFMNNAAIVVVIEGELALEVRRRLEHLDGEDLHHLGGGLSRYDDIFNTFEMPRVDASDGSCRGTEAANFLNDSFDFLFSRQSEQLRLAYCRNFSNRFEFLDHEGCKLFAAGDYPLNKAERDELEIKFIRMVEALEMTAFMTLDNSPISSPPWRERQIPIGGLVAESSTAEVV